jgi:hypothetical protein
MIFNIEERRIVPRGRYGQLINLIKKDDVFATLYCDYLISRGITLQGRRGVIHKEFWRILTKLDKKDRVKLLEIFKRREEANKILNTKLDVNELQKLILERIAEER